LRMCWMGRAGGDAHLLYVGLGRAAVRRRGDTAHVVSNCYHLSSGLRVRWLPHMGCGGGLRLPTKGVWVRVGACGCVCVGPSSAGMQQSAARCTESRAALWRDVRKTHVCGCRAACWHQHVTVPAVNVNAVSTGGQCGWQCALLGASAALMGCQGCCCVALHAAVTGVVRASGLFGGAGLFHAPCTRTGRAPALFARIEGCDRWCASCV
jgi:hypothetical protein